jgi:hypothetical protein
VAGSCSHSDPNLHSPLLWGREAQPLGEGITLNSASTGKDMGKTWPLRGEDGVKGYPNPVTALSARERLPGQTDSACFLQQRLDLLPRWQRLLDSSFGDAQRASSVRIHHGVL